MAFPGRNLDTESKDVERNVFDSLNPNKLPPVELLRSGQRVGVDFFTDGVFPRGDNFFLVALGGHRSTRNSVFLADRRAVLAFLSSNMNPSRMEGVDAVVANEQYTQFVICNHDGDVFFIDLEQSSG